MSKASQVFQAGNHTVKLITVDEKSGCPFRSSTTSVAPKPILIATPCEEGEYPVLIFLHGYLLYNSFYSQLFQHVASHGFIVAAPQMYIVAGPDSTDEINCTAAVIDWLSDGLQNVLPKHVQPNLRKLVISGHSRGGKVAFALALGHAKTSTNLKLSAIIGVDPVDGMDKGKQTNPPVLTYVPHSLQLNMPALIIGSGFGELKRNALFPPCAPKGVSHQDFFDECCAPAYHVVAKDYGHLDMLDDETKGLRGKASYCLCKNGESRKPMREFVAGIMVAFMNAYLHDEKQLLHDIVEKPELSPIELSVAAFLMPDFEIGSLVADKF